MKTAECLLKMASICALIMAMSLGFIFSARATVDVVVATPELADIAQQVGGNRVSVYSVARANRDYHRVEPRPSDVSKSARADLVVRIGLDLDMWMDSLINASGNRAIAHGGKGYVDASEGIRRLEVPREQITGASGDIHVNGNPHYFYDPENGKIIARNIADGLSRIDPGNRSTYERNYSTFAKEIDRRTENWQKELAPYRGKSVVTYHQSAIYFLRRFGLRGFGTLEVKPGIPPSASHIRDLIGRMKDQKVTAIVIESVYPDRFPDLISRETGVKYQVVPYSVGSMGAKNYFDLIGAWVDKYKVALR
jgi:zinc/manganese transport system substrate-binding protein